jgi:hypothetical protein
MASDEHGGAAVPTTASARDELDPSVATPAAGRARSRAAAVLTRLNPGANVGEAVSPHVVSPGGGAGDDVVIIDDGYGGGPAHNGRAYLGIGLAAAIGLAGAVLLVGTSPLWKGAPLSTWRLDIPGLHTSGNSLYAATTFIQAIVMLALGWLGLLAFAAHTGRSDRSRLKVVLAVTALWTLPFLIAPIQLSTDTYSYAVQGDMASVGIDPSVYGPNILPNHASNAFYRASDPVWRDTPAPYGPVAVALEKVVVTVTGFDVANSMWGFRAIALVGVIMTGFGVYVIARARRVSAALALALAIANPVVLIHLIGGAHNDALMMGLLVLGLAAFESRQHRVRRPVFGDGSVESWARAREARAAARQQPTPGRLLTAGRVSIAIGVKRANHRAAVAVRRALASRPGAATFDALNAPLTRKIAAVVLITLAVCVKLPAILGLGFVAWNWHGSGTTWRQRLTAIPTVGAIFVATTAVCSVIAGIGIGWLTALKSTGSVYSTFSIFTEIGFLASDLLGGLGREIDPIASANVARALGLLVACAIIGFILWRSPKLGVVKSVGYALLALMICGPVIWPWYLPAGFALLAAVGIKRLRPTLIVMILASSFFVFPTSVDPIQNLSRYQHWLGFGVVLLIGALCVAAQYVARVVESRQHRLRIGGVAIEEVLVGPVPATSAAPAASAATEAVTAH